MKFVVCFKVIFRFVFVKTHECNLSDVFRILMETVYPIIDLEYNRSVEWLSNVMEQLKINFEILFCAELTLQYKFIS